MRLFHRTPAAASILREGFKDDPRRRRQGVWLSDVPLDEGESIKGCTTLVVEVPAEIIESFRVEQGRSYLEWCVPSSILNSLGPPTIFADDWAGIPRPAFGSASRGSESSGLRGRLRKPTS